MHIEDDKNGASVNFQPPLIFIIWMFAGYGLQYLWPIGFGSASGFKIIGGVLVLLGICIIILARQSFKRAWPVTNFH